MQHTTDVSFVYETAEQAQRVERSLTPEIGDIADERSRACLSRTDETLVLTVESTDLVALRAGVNTWLSLVDVAERAGAVDQ